MTGSERQCWLVALADGERLNERVLARDLGVSTTPLKEALRQLESEGLIRTEARGACSSRLGSTGGRDDACPRSDRKRHRWLRGQACDGGRSRKSRGVGCGHRRPQRYPGDVERLIDLNELFQPNSRLLWLRLLCRLQGKQQTYDHAARVALLKEEAERRRALVEHGAILRAIAGRDQDAAERLMRDNIVRSGHRHIETVFGQAPKGE